MLFAIKYHPRSGRTEAESQRLRELLMMWEAPAGVDVRHHFHYVSAGGVLIVETNDPGSLYEAMGPFKSLVEFEVEPVINFVEALSISTDVSEWAATAKNSDSSAKAA